MIKSKYAYLEKITRQLRLRTLNLEREIEGATPPSIFIGTYNYPKVYAGPMITSIGGDVHIMDSPEEWIPQNKTLGEIIDYRLGLIRGKKQVNVRNLEDRMVERLQEISLAKASVESEARFTHKPRGFFFSEENAPHGPSATLKAFEVNNTRWDRHLEKAYYDGDLRASEAIFSLYREEVPFSSIQKAFSVGALGIEDKRRLVPTRWSITACDSILADQFLGRVLRYDIIDSYKLYEFESLKNSYIVILTPTPWQYEWIEAFIRILGGEELIFSDYEIGEHKSGYSKVGGCYYTAKMAVLDALDREKKQAGAIIFREAYPGYVSLGVFNVRENIKNAMKQKPIEFNNFKNALEYADKRLELPLGRFIRNSHILKEMLRGRQTRLDEFHRGMM